MTTTETQALAVARLTRENWDLRSEATALRDQLAGNIPEATRRLQSKVDRQRAALDRLQRRVENQRAALRHIERLGRGLTESEWAEARESVGSDQLRERLDGQVPTAA